MASEGPHESLLDPRADRCTENASKNMHAKEWPPPFSSLNQEVAIRLAPMDRQVMFESGETQAGELECSGSLFQ